ncbi:hypothetical protein R3P38DRAFT_2814067 [Favolaschia claudopus]|uniref:Uncharacterized protein n=1 Tax=Favolaschia claudopus TaxID=2862362 RepID=A0AAV9Z4A3_9AGAR
MPAKPRHLRDRASSFLKRAKGVIQQLSPRKRRKTRTNSPEREDKENLDPSAAPLDASSDASSIVPASDTITEDVFLATCSDVENAHSYDFFRSDGPRDVPTSAPAQFYHEYSLPPPPKLSPYRTTVEEVPDEDDVSHLSSRSTITVNALDSRFSEESFLPPEDHAGLAKAAASDPATQDAYAHVYDAFTAPGKLREAPSVAAAKAAVDDLKAALRGESRGKSGGGKLAETSPPRRLHKLPRNLNFHTASRCGIRSVPMSVVRIWTDQSRNVTARDVHSVYLAGNGTEVGRIWPRDVEFSGDFAHKTPWRGVSPGWRVVPGEGSLIIFTSYATRAFATPATALGTFPSSPTAPHHRSLHSLARVAAGILRL